MSFLPKRLSFYLFCAFLSSASLVFAADATRNIIFLRQPTINTQPLTANSYQLTAQTGEVLPFFGERKVLEEAETQEFPGNISVTGNITATGYLDLGLLSTAPDAAEGRLYYNSTDSKTYFYTGNEWTEMGGGGGLWTDADGYINPTNATGFQIADTTGDTTIPGTGTITGLLAANGGITADSGVFTVTDVTGAIHTSNNLDVDGVITAGSTPVTLTGATGYILEGAITQNTLDDSEIEDNSLTAGSLAADSVSDSELDGGFAWTLDTDLNIDANTLVVSYDDDRVGVGTAGPSALLDVAGNMDIDGNISKPSSSLYINAAGAGADVVTQTGGTDKFAVKSTGMLWQTGTGCGGIVPQGMIGMFDTACPSGWSEVTSFQTRFVAGHDANGVYCEYFDGLCKRWYTYCWIYCCDYECTGTQRCEAGWCGTTDVRPAASCSSGTVYCGCLSGLMVSCHLVRYCYVAGYSCPGVGNGGKAHITRHEIYNTRYREVVFCKKD